MKLQTLSSDYAEFLHDDEFYYGDLSKMALSSSAIKLLLDSPKTFAYVMKYGQEDSEAFRSGWLFHTAILQPEIFDQQIFVDVQSKNTKLYKEAKDAHGRVFTIKEKNEAERMADAFLKNQTAVSYLAGAAFEQPTVGLIDGYPFRGKADIIAPNRIVDLKSCADIKSFPFSAKRYGYDVQVYIYCEIFGMSYEDFTFLVLDKGSLDIGIFHVSEEFYLAGQAKTREGIERYQMFFEDEISLDDYYIEDTL